LCKYCIELHFVPCKVILIPESGKLVFCFWNPESWGAIHSKQNSNRSNREKWSTSKGGPVFSVGPNRSIEFWTEFWLNGSRPWAFETGIPLTIGIRNFRTRSIQQKFPEISVQNSMDRIDPTGKVSKKLVHLLRWTTFPGRTGRNFG